MRIILRIMKNINNILEESFDRPEASFDQALLLMKLKKAVGEYLAGNISASDLKHTTAPFGIYQQRNDKFMVRIRITGGHLDLRKSQIIAEGMKNFRVGFMHLTTRQNLQLHDVDPVNIVPLVKFLTRQGIPFRGGGGIHLEIFSFQQKADSPLILYSMCFHTQLL